MGLFRKGSRGARQGQGGFEVTYMDRRPVWMHDRMEVQLCEGDVTLEVVGESFHQADLWHLVGGRGCIEEYVRVEVHAVLAAEPDNPHDANAVSVWVGGRRVGHLSRNDASRYRPGLIVLERRYGRPIALEGVIVGGGMRDDGPGMLGVFLRHDPQDFGLPPKAASHTWFRTGLSNAAASDDADSSYDLSWMRNLPADEIQAIAALRQLLTRSTAPMERHFQYSQLEALLYRGRKAFASALDEYDETCLRHDGEMESIRQAFMAKWGHVPVLDTYRQMAIRQQKAENFTQALWWAERGIILYGNDAARPEAVDDLRQRAATYATKITAISSPHELKPPPLQQPEVETLTCIACGRTFQRPRVRGRKPVHCPDCRPDPAGGVGPISASAHGSG